MGFAIVVAVTFRSRPLARFPPGGILGRIFGKR